MVKNFNISKLLVIISFLLPALSFYVLFYLYPVANGIRLSFFKWDGFSAEPQFVGLANYWEMFHDPIFWKSMMLNIKVVFLSLGTQLPLALFLASLLSKKGPGMRFFRTVLFIPQMLSLVAVGVLWQMIYHPINGLANTLLNVFGVGAIDWLGDSNNALTSLIITSTWTYFGFHMILQMAGMSAIPQEIYDAARLETKNPFRIFFHITIPLLRETILISVISITTGAFAHLLGLFWVMTQGGPIRSTEILGIYIYVEAFRKYHIGYANAVAVTLLIVLALIVAVTVRFGSQERLEF